MPPKWNEITWYSKLASIVVLLVVVPILGFRIGVVYQDNLAAVSSAEINQAKINQIIAQINALKAQLAQTTVSVLSTSITKDLQIGSTGVQVTALQTYLNTKGFLKSKPTGYYGQLTKTAVIKWQANTGISPTGYVGPKSRGVLNTLVQTTTSNTKSGGTQTKPTTQTPTTGTTATTPSAPTTTTVPVVNAGGGGGGGSTPAPVVTPPVVVPPVVTTPTPTPPTTTSGSGTCEAVSLAKCYYVATNGNDSNAGTFSAPFKTFKPAVVAVSAGDFIYARGGTYTSTNSTINSAPEGRAMIAIHDWDGYGSASPSSLAFTVRSGSPGKPITVRNYPGEIPMFSQNGNIQISAKAYWTIQGFDIAGESINMWGGGGFGNETHDIIIQNNTVHDVVTIGGNNPGLIRINRADASGAYNIFIRNNILHTMSDPVAPGVWSGLADSQHYGAVTVLSGQDYGLVGGTGYIEISGNEIYNLPQVFFFKNPFLGPVDILNNTIHDSGSLGIATMSNMHFNRNLVYGVPSGFWQVGGTQRPTDPVMIPLTGKNDIIQYNTFVGLNSLFATAGTGMARNATITNNVFFGMTGKTTGAYWDIPAYIHVGDGDSVDPAQSLLQTFISNNNCFITPSADMLFTSRYEMVNGSWMTEFNNYTKSRQLFGFDVNSNIIVESNPVNVFVSPSTNDYHLKTPSSCSGMGLY
jgi:peptidoglycan hydrolase-like protein with peptidoglycan-binding domain